MQVYTGKPADRPAEVNQKIKVVLEMTKGLQGKHYVLIPFFQFPIPIPIPKFGEQPIPSTDPIAAYKNKNSFKTWDIIRILNENI